MENKKANGKKNYGKNHQVDGNRHPQDGYADEGNHRGYQKTSDYYKIFFGHDQADRRRDTYNQITWQNQSDKNKEADYFEGGYPCTQDQYVLKSAPGIWEHNNGQLQKKVDSHLQNNPQADNKNKGQPFDYYAARQNSQNNKAKNPVDIQEKPTQNGPYRNEYIAKNDGWQENQKATNASKSKPNNPPQSIPDKNKYTDGPEPVISSNNKMPSPSSNENYGGFCGNNELEDLSIHTSYTKENEKPHIKEFKPKGPLNILMLAEKPSIARSISHILAEKTKTQKGIASTHYVDTRKGATPIHYFKMRLFGHQADVTFSSVSGHLFNRDFHSSNQSWQQNDPQNLFTADTVRKDIPSKMRIIQQLHDLSRGKDLVILWLDNDREGENICFQILDIIYRNLKNSPFRRIYRPKFSSVINAEIARALGSIDQGPDLKLSLSSDARQIIDLKVGVVFTRYQSLYLKDKYVELKNKVVSYGPCQTPTLGLVVARDKQINEFKPQKYYKIIYVASEYSQQITINITEVNRVNNSKSGSHDKTASQFEIVPVIADANFNEKTAATKCAKETEVVGTVVEVLRYVENRQRPKPLNTVSFLKFCCQKFNISSFEALAVAEKLYLRGFVTYPRTESTKYPKGFAFEDVVKSVRLYENQIFKEWADDLLAKDKYLPSEGIDTEDHAPLTPTEKAPQYNKLNDIERSVYEFIVESFLSSISEEATCEVVENIIQFKDKKFRYVQRKLIQESYFKYSSIVSFPKEQTSSISLKKGMKISMISMDVKECVTQPPEKMTESELVELMEKYKIGTDASMARHIQNIISREYVVIEGANRTMVSTTLGKKLVEFYMKTQKDLVLPNLRDHMMSRVDKISKSEEKFESVVSDMLKQFKDKFVNCKDHIEELNFSLKDDFKAIENYELINGKAFSKCGGCNGFMNYSKSSNTLICKFCNLTLELPKTPEAFLVSNRCESEVFKPDEGRNKRCGFQEIEYRVSKMINGRATEIFITICPKCNNQNQGYFSQPDLLLGKCTKCEHGDFYLCKNQSNSEWFYLCSSSKCGYAVKALSNAVNIVINQRHQCQSCSLYTVNGKFKTHMNGLENTQLNHVCPLCDEKLQRILQDFFKAKNSFKYGKKQRYQNWGRKRY